MAVVLGSALAVLFVVALPYWLPGVVVGLRARIFTRINGDEGIAIPGPLIDVAAFTRVYADPAADGRSRGAALSDLFWYWLSPGAELHQEHLEPGPRYEEVARTTRRILGLSRRATEELAARCAGRVLDQRASSRRDARVVRLRDLVMPIWADFYYELVFGQECPPAARALIVGNADDVVTALKCCGLRHMERRARLTRFLEQKVRAGEVAHALPEGLSSEERALYLQGVFFNTAVVQMSEALTHLLLAIAQHPEVQARLVAGPADHDYLDRVINEVLRLHPLFGVSHRITSGAIALEGGTTIPDGSVLCFHHARFQAAGFEHAQRFDPDRWERLAARDVNFIPFGVTANRPCPAQSVALITLRVTARVVLQHFALRSSAAHTRSIPNRGPCLLLPRERALDPLRARALLAAMQLRDRWEDVGRSVLQLVLGSYMVWDARRQRLCERYFEAQRTAS
jgi:Cytochrome P450